VKEVGEKRNFNRKKRLYGVYVEKEIHEKIKGEKCNFFAARKQKQKFSASVCALEKRKNIFKTFSFNFYM